MAKQRHQVEMTPDEVATMLASCRKVQLATLSLDGYPHLVTMYYALVDGKIAFWTYGTSQKALNLARDPRITCLVETGEAYFDLRGVQVQGTVEMLADLQSVYRIGMAVSAVVGGGRAGGQDSPQDQLGSLAMTETAGSASESVMHASRKRVAYLVVPKRVMSWDHTKLQH